MRATDTILNIHRDRGFRGLPLERVYKHLFNPAFYLHAYGKISRNVGAMTQGATPETVDGMTLKKIHRIIARLKQGRYRWTPARRTAIRKANGKMRPLGIPMSLAYCLSSPSGLGIVIAEALRLGQIEPVQTVATDRTAHTLPH
jgi:hypothetical protein